MLDTALTHTPPHPLPLCIVRSKPGNILLASGPNGPTCKISDFGLAR